MTNEREPREVGYSGGLGPLPDPHDPPVYGYTSADMRAYARQALAAERERCARLCEALADDCDMYKPLDNCRGVALRAAAARIRGA